MAESGGGDPRSTNADLTALPPELAKQSISSAAIILPLDAALAAIAHMAEQGRRVENWEGWVKFRDGTRARSLSHGGSFALPRDAKRAAESATAAIRRAQSTWDRNPEYVGTMLYFGLMFGNP